MSTRFPFYELAHRRVEDDGAVRRCYQGADESTRALFVWQGMANDSGSIVQAQLLLGDETFVEWRQTRTTSGVTSRVEAADGAAECERPAHGHGKGVRTLHATGDRGALLRAREVLLASDLPDALVHVLVERLPLERPGTES